ncbi:MAG: hypothetical protein PUP91_33180 [Rhizonema sp. PD37]|nr:hypothetical protein [Rhizonema sp. PD37]
MTIVSVVVLEKVVVTIVLVAKYLAVVIVLGTAMAAEQQLVGEMLLITEG